MDGCKSVVSSACRAASNILYPLKKFLYEMLVNNIQRQLLRREVLLLLTKAEKEQRYLDMNGQY